MFCSQCGNQVAPGSQFCSNCGTPVGASGPVGQPGYEVTQQQPVPPPPGSAVPPPPVGPPIAPGPAAPPPPGPQPEPSRNRRLAVEIALVVVIIGVLLGVAGALIVGGKSDDNKSKTAGASATDTGTSTDTGDTADTADTGATDSGHRSTTTTTTTTTAPLSPVDAARRDDAAGYAFMQKLEGLLGRANVGRSEIAPLIQAVQNNCSRDPNDAIVAVNRVIDNRQSLLDEIATSPLNPGTFQVDLATKFQKAMNTSIAADRGYAGWLNYVRDYYYRPPEGCYGSPPTDSNWDAAQAAEAQVTPAKADFIAAYNAQATRFGMRTWTVDDI